MYVMVNRQGTSMGETALCSTCYKNIPTRANARAYGLAASDIGDDREFHLVYDNDELECTVCGAETLIFEWARDGALYAVNAAAQRIGIVRIDEMSL